MRPYRLLCALPLLTAACGGAAEPEHPRPQLAVPPFTVIDRWDPPSIPYRLDPGGGPVPADEFTSAVEDAMQVWEATGRVTFQPIAEGLAPKRVLKVHWEDGSDPASLYFGRDTSVAVTKGSGTARVELIFDAARPWRLDRRAFDSDGRRDPDLYHTAIHELGHVLGLGHVEDEGSVMHPQRELGRIDLGAGDLAGVESLYGRGDGLELAAERGDLRIGEHLVLYAVAPPGRSDWTLFDSDGDGRDELLVWETEGPRGHLTVYHFEPGRQGPRLGRTAGPLLGVAGPRVRLACWVDGSGARLLDCVRPDGDVVQRRFLDTGLPGPASVLKLSEAEASRQARRTSGDVDGDGVPDQVEPAGSG